MTSMNNRWYRFIYIEWVQYVIITALSLGLIVMVAHAQLWRPPNDFPTHEIVTIEKGQTLTQVGDVLARRDIIRSPLVFRLVTELIGGEHVVQAGDYYFEEPISVFQAAYRVSHQKQHLVAKEVTIPEGYTIFEMADRISAVLPRFDKAQFIEEAGNYRGYLFPDTYEFLPGTSADDIVTQMHKQFQQKIEPLEGEIASSSRTLPEIVTMASLLEEEADRYRHRRRIAGVLWTRLEEGMPLQVDAAFSRVNGKNTYELTTRDLETDAPFNTYTNTGLPPAPITNPGLSSIRAALRPIESDHLYYLSDRQGELYFSRTLREHQRKKAIYVN